MIVEELLPLVKQLDRAGKLQLMQSLLYELAGEDGIKLADTQQSIIENHAYPIWSPTNAHQAADTLLTLLEKDEEKYG